MDRESSPKTEDATSTLLAPARCSQEGDERMGVDEMLQKYSGEFGPWQLRHFALVSLAWALDAFHTMVTIFADRNPAWRCTGPACSDDVCQLEPGSWEWVGGREVSTVAEWGLVCGNKYKAGLVQSAFFAGCMVDPALLESASWTANHVSVHKNLLSGLFTFVIEAGWVIYGIARRHLFWESNRHHSIEFMYLRRRLQKPT